MSELSKRCNLEIPGDGRWPSLLKWPCKTIWKIFEIFEKLWREWLNKFFFFFSFVTKFPSRISWFFMVIFIFWWSSSVSFHAFYTFYLLWLKVFAVHDGMLFFLTFHVYIFFGPENSYELQKVFSYIFYVLFIFYTYYILISFFDMPLKILILLKYLL